jgi:hypothetical protein
MLGAIQQGPQWRPGGHGDTAPSLGLAKANVRTFVCGPGQAQKVALPLAAPQGQDQRQLYLVGRDGQNRGDVLLSPDLVSAVCDVERHLRHVLLSYMDYYNATCTHLSLNKDAPALPNAAAEFVQFRGRSKGGVESVIDVLFRLNIGEIIARKWLAVLRVNTPPTF